MTKISNQDVYIIDSDVSDLDSVIGTDGNTLTKTTKNFLLGKLRAYFKSGLSPLTGGTLRFTEISYTGELYATVEGLVNGLDPFFVVDQYHVVVVSLNGAKYILKLQDVSVGLDKTPVIAGDFITLPTSVGTTGKGIVSVVKTSTAGLVDTFTITYTDATTSTFTMSNGAAGTGNAGNGISTVVKTGTAGLVDTYTITFTNATTTTFNVTNGSNGSDAANNLQRDASASFSVGDSDNNYVIQLKNATDIVVTIPDTLSTAKFCCGFIRKGVGEVSFAGGGTMVLNNPVGFRINAQYDPAFIERDNTSQICSLLGNTKV